MNLSHEFHTCGFFILVSSGTPFFFHLKKQILFILLYFKFSHIYTM